MKHLMLYILFSILIGTPLLAQSKKAISVDDLQKEMIKKTADINSISCEFVQKKNMEYLDAVIESKGTLCFDKQNRLRWEYLEPFSYLITINKGTFTINTDGKISEYDIESNKVFSQVSELIISSVNGSIFTDAKFKVDAFVDATEYLIYMEPFQDEMKDVLSKIEMHVDVNDFSVNKVLMFEKADNYTEIQFINKQFNEILPDSMFTGK